MRLDIGDAGAIVQPEMVIEVYHSGRLSQNEQSEVAAAVGRMLRVGEDFSEVYALCEKRGGRGGKLTAGLGRLLRSPTVFEDVVKTICTTNIQWGGTKRMVEGLVHTLGERYAGDPALRAFPTAEAMAAAPPETFTASVRLGYRGDYVHTLAKRVAAGETDLEALRDSGIPTPELKEDVRWRRIHGAGQHGLWRPQGQDDHPRRSGGTSGGAGQTTHDAVRHDGESHERVGHGGFRWI